MRIGLVESLNARPLTWGIENDSSLECIYSSPRILSEMLLRDELDTALISSVEILRNIEFLGYSTACGVCAQNLVRSILFFQNKKSPPPYESIQVDVGSKSSVALLQLLHNMEFGSIPSVVPTPPEEIRKAILSGEGSHLLFGDNALMADWDNDIYTVIDLAEWWNRRTGLYFIFALWAYPKDRPIKDEFFLNSLQQGIDSIDIIIQSEVTKGKIFHSIEFMNSYLREDLQYQPGQLHWNGLIHFEEELRKRGIL